MRILIPIALTIGFLLTWAGFPEIGDRYTSFALGPWFSYGLPIFLVWFLFVASFSVAERKANGLSEGQEFGHMITLFVLLSCWGFGIGHALATSKSLLYYFAMLLGGIVVIATYWGCLLISVILFVFNIPAFVKGLHYLLVPHPARSIVERSRPSADDAKALASVMRKHRPDMEHPPPAFVSANFERKAIALAKRVHADGFLARAFAERVRGHAADKENNR